MFATKPFSCSQTLPLKSNRLKGCNTFRIRRLWPGFSAQPAITISCIANAMVGDVSNSKKCPVCRYICWEVGNVIHALCGRSSGRCKTQNKPIVRIDIYGDQGKQKTQGVFFQAIFGKECDFVDFQNFLSDLNSSVPTSLDQPYPLLHLSNPKHGHTTGGSGRSARQSGWAGSGKIGCQLPRQGNKKSTVPSKASKKRRFNVFQEARTDEHEQRNRISS